MMSVQQQAPQGQPQAMPQAGGNQNVTPFHSASLYVGDLAPDITESTLFEIFNQVGPVASIRVCRDTITRRSLGYAYVNFHNVADAERALDTMNFTLIKDNPCRIMWSQRDPSMRRSGVGNVFVKNLDETIDNKALYDTFSLFGNILSCKVATDDAGNSKGYGYVHYETAESANEAIAKIDGMVVGGKQVHVGHFVRRNDRAGQADWTNIYVKNIPLAWDEEKLRSEFAKFGTINSVKIQRESSDPASLSRGFGFINFEDHEAAESAVSEMNGKTVSGPAVKKPAAAAPAAAPAAAAAAKKEDGDAAPAAAAKEEEKEAAKEGDKEAEAEKPAEGEKEAEKELEAPAAAADAAAADKEQPAAEEGAAAATAAEPAADAEPEVETRELFCCRAQKRTERQRELQAKYEALKVERMNKYQGVNLYVKNLDEAVDEAALREAFATQGTITSVRIMKDAVTGNSKGFGFVCFSSPEEATKAVQEMNNRMVASKPIYVALAQRKEVRRAQLEAQYAQQRGGLGPRGPMGAMQPGMYGMGMPYMMPGQPGGMPQPPRAGGYPMMPQMMGPRGAPRGGPNSMQPYPGRGTYPMPAYAMGAMPVQQQQQQVPRRGASGGRGGAGGRGMPAGVAMQAGVVPGAGMNGAGRGGGAQPMGVPMGQMPAGVQQQQRGVMPMQGMQQQRGASGGAPQQAQAGGVPQQGNFKYTQQVRNPPAQGQAPQMGGMMAGGGGAAMMAPPPQAESLTAQALAAASPEMQKNMIGERLYPLIHESQPELAGKITGMLLEMDNGELLHLLESPDSLKAKIQEALQVLEAHTTD